MPRVDIVKTSPVSKSGRSRQLEALFDVPRQDLTKVEWHGDLPIESFDWNVGLIVGPSGCGKSSILENLFGDTKSFTWTKESVIDDFDKRYSMIDVSTICQAVGFNTIPSWLRPYAVLSNGEKFRVDLARRLIGEESPIVVDEFTSIVDRQVAQIASHAVQKYVRKTNKKFIAASCHYDIVDWLQPDWILEPTTMTFSRRELQRRPSLDIAICRVPYQTWFTFAPFHYMSADLNRVAKCFALFVNNRIAAFAGVLHRPISHGTNATSVWGISRLVTLPDWQGLGLGPILCDVIGSLYKSLRHRLRTYPAHPALINSFVKSEKWARVKYQSMTKRSHSNNPKMIGRFGGRPNAVFEYVGEAMDTQEAIRLMELK